MPSTPRRLDCAVRVIVRAVGRTCYLAVCAAGAGWTPHAVDAQPSALTTAWLLDADAAERARRIESRRPPPLGADQRARVLASLPQEGEVTVLDARASQKLRELEAVLHVGRRDGVVVVKVIDLPQAVVALFERCVVLISRPALELLSGSELQALVAHEIGHEFVWDDWVRARHGGDRSRLHDVELVCDVIAMSMVQALGGDPRTLLQGLEKVTRFNDARFGRPDRHEDHPTLAARREVWRALVGRSGR